MTDIYLALVLIISLFVFFILLRSFFALKVCALCAAVSTTWIFLLLSFFTGHDINPVLIGILMGGSAVGLMYWLEQKVGESLQMFKLPFFLSLVSATYFLLMRQLEFRAVVILILLWIFVAILYMNRNADGLKDAARKLIECCKNW